jgi:hypothetical protein
MRHEPRRQGPNVQRTKERLEREGGHKKGGESEDGRTTR